MDQEPASLVGSHERSTSYQKRAATSIMRAQSLHKYATKPATVQKEVVQKGDEGYTGNNTHRYCRQQKA